MIGQERAKNAQERAESSPRGPRSAQECPMTLPRVHQTAPGAQKSQNDASEKDLGASWVAFWLQKNLEHPRACPTPEIRFFIHFRIVQYVQGEPRTSPACEMSRIGLAKCQQIGVCLIVCTYMYMVLSKHMLYKVDFDFASLSGRFGLHFGSLLPLQMPPFGHPLRALNRSKN